MSDRKLRPVKETKETVRCAIYTRKSSEEGLEQEFNSLNAQREAGEAYIRSQQHEGWIALPEHYDDGGFSGGNMERPGLGRLLADIVAKKIDCVVVYKVDRLSRSLADFARIMETFDRSGVAFVSVTQAFNTGNSMGRLMLNVLLSFAQFEREISGERIRDKIAATRRKGKWAGGAPPLGYDVRTSPLRIEINPEEAEQVRTIFDLYRQHGRLLPVVEELQRRDWRTKRWTTQRGNPRGGRVFTKSSLHGLLTSVIYAGKQVYKDEVHPGEHEAIIVPEVWQAVQERLARHGPPEIARSRSDCLLAGLLRCGPCGTAMSPSFSAKGGRRYRYYICTTAMKRGWSTCPSKALPMGEVERFVLSQLPSKLEGPPSAQNDRIRELVDRIEYDGTSGKLLIHLKPQEPS